MQTAGITDLIKKQALTIGFNAVGIAKAEKNTNLTNIYKTLANKGYFADMQYMQRNIDKRADISLLVPGAKSVIVLLTSYYPKQKQPQNIPQIAYYAYGNDYHTVLKNKMQILWDFIKQLYPQLNGRIFTDSAPVAEKYYATKAGLGYIGKNSCLINKHLGSFVFISELVVNIELEYDKPTTTNHCGNCTLCINNCPTNAIVAPGIIDSRKCISYQTIENKGQINPELKNKFKNHIFGCDICQQVCPWNKKPVITNIPEFYPNQSVLNLTHNNWSEMDTATFNQLFKNSPIKRAKLSGLKRNAQFLKNN